MEKIIVYLPKVKIYFKDLIDILFEKEYFGFMENAEVYVLKIRSFIEQNIDAHTAQNTPAGFLQYGDKYIRYKANKHTAWYIFFSQIEQYYFVKFITNNHTELYAEMNL